MTESSHLAPLLFAVVVAGNVACNDVGDFPSIITTRNAQRRRGNDAGLEATARDGGERRADAEPSGNAPSSSGRDAEPLLSVVLVPFPDAGALDSGSADVAALQALLAERSPACLQCAAANCPNAIEACGRLTGHADGGAAVGTRKAELCVETVRCVLESQCSVSDPLKCYCGDAITEQCVSTQTGGDGPCKDVLERGFETTDQRFIISRLEDHAFEGGWGMSVAQCLVDNACTSCFPGPSRDQ